MKVAFLVNDLELSGGIGVVITHARNLAARHNFDVTLVLTAEPTHPPWEYEGLSEIKVQSLAEAHDNHFDIAVSTWWETAFSLFQLSAGHYAAFIQSIEDRFYQSHDLVQRLRARSVLDLPVTFITEAGWIKDTLAALRPNATCHLVRNGIDKRVFASPAQIDRNESKPLRVLVEGSPTKWFKGVNEAIGSVRMMKEDHVLTVVATSRDGLDHNGTDRVIGPLAQTALADVYSETDVFVKMSRVEGMYGPPLEAFHMGATCLTTEVTGHEEYIRHRHNALVCDWDDSWGAARQLDLLARDRQLLHELRSNAFETARGWPSWEHSSDQMAAVLEEIRREAVPPTPEAMRGLLLTLCDGTALQRIALHDRDFIRRQFRRIGMLARIPGVSAAFAARHTRVGEFFLGGFRKAVRSLLGG